MTKRFSLLLFVLVFALIGIFLSTDDAFAGECFEYPASAMSGTATVKSGVFVRTVACMEGSEVVGTLAAGETVTVHAVDDGWYEVSRNDGTRGWVWQDFLTINAEKTGETYEKSEEEVEAYKEELREEKTEEEYESKTDDSLVDRMKGRILLQVEDHGEAHYVHPETGERYYMKDGPTAYEMMRAFGLGITNADLSQIPEVSDEDAMLGASSVCGSNSLAARLRGKILLQIEEHGEAFYIHPDKCRRIYMKDGASAYQIMRKLSLGITNSDLSKVPSREFEAVPYDEKDEQPEEEVLGVKDEVNVLPVGEVPSNIDIAALNEYWLKEVNALRAERGLRQLVIDPRWQETANEYAALMAKNQWFGHERDGGLSMHDWIDTKGLEFTERYSAGGWNDNYFTENISWGYTDNSQAGVEKVLNYSKDFFLGEIDWNGPHYRTIYHPDWNSVGLGFYFEPKESGSYKVYIVMHYGSLEM